MYASTYQLGIITSGRAASLEEAKAQFLTNWQKCRIDAAHRCRVSSERVTYGAGK